MWALGWGGSGRGLRACAAISGQLSVQAIDCTENLIYRQVKTNAQTRSTPRTRLMRMTMVVVVVVTMVVVMMMMGVGMGMVIVAYEALFFASFS